MKNVKDTEINAYWRAKRNAQYAKAHPERDVRLAAKDFLSKKEALKEVSEGKEEYQEELLTDLFDKIRAILTNEGLPQIKAKREAGMVK